MSVNQAGLSIWRLYLSRTMGITILKGNLTVTSSRWALTLHISLFCLEKLQELCVTLCQSVLLVMSLSSSWTEGLTIHKGTVTLDNSWEAVTVHTSWSCLEQLNELCLSACYSRPSIKTCTLSRMKGFTIHKDKLTVASSRWAVTLQGVIRKRHIC